MSVQTMDAKDRDTGLGGRVQLTRSNAYILVTHHPEWRVKQKSANFNVTVNLVKLAKFLS